ncbi:MAG: DUF3048 domain-containing protein [Symbiobacteriia bacterium]
MRPSPARLRAAIASPLLLTLILSLLAGCSRTPAAGPATTPPPPPPVTAPPPDTRPKSRISGLPYDAANAGPVVAVMVENHRDARPQSGLLDADLVYEALAEGGISRFMAIYYGTRPKVIGPVRSARPYYVLLAHEWDAIYAHCGGDPKDLDPIHQWGVADADEINNAGEAFWRTTDRKAPHNLYTSIDKLLQHAKRAYPQRTFAPEPATRWSFIPWTDKAPVQQVDIAYDRNYTVTYKFEAGVYRRYMNGKIHSDKESGQPLAVTNILIQFVPTRVAYPDGGLKMDLVGKGKAEYIIGGRFVQGTWAKDDVASATRFLDDQGQSISLTAGQTWIQIVPTGAGVVVQQAAAGN